MPPPAREKFREAWAHEEDLDPATRNQLKDKLTLLQPKRLPVQFANASPEQLTPIQKAELEAQEKTRRLFREVTAELANTEQSKTVAPLDALDELERLRRRVDGAEVDEQAKRSISMMVDRSIAEQKKYIEANRAKIDLDLQNDAVRAEIATEQARESRIDEEVSALVNSFNDLIQERRFQEAEVIAKQVQELKPDDPIAVSMFHTSRMGTRLLMDEEVRDAKELMFIDSLIDVDRSAIAINPNMPMTLPEAQDWEALSRRRLRSLNDGDSRLSAAEQVIQQKLMSEVNVKYTNRSLSEVLNELSAVTGVPVVIDERALSAVRVTTETPVTLELPEQHQAQECLELDPQQDGIDLRDRKRRAFDYQHGSETQQGLSEDLSRDRPGHSDSQLHQQLRRRSGRCPSCCLPDVQSAGRRASGAGIDDRPGNRHGQELDAGSHESQRARPVQFDGSSRRLRSRTIRPSSGGGGGSFADFQSLIDLIQTTVVPDTWEALGGPSTMAPYPQNLSLVISTTSDVHDQITDLLESLRRLQNLQITIEVRFITLADSFAEQIGVDFQARLTTTSQTCPTTMKVQAWWSDGTGSPPCQRPTWTFA